MPHIATSTSKAMSRSFWVLPHSMSRSFWVLPHSLTLCFFDREARPPPVNQGGSGADSVSVDVTSVVS